MNEKRRVMVAVCACALLFGCSDRGAPKEEVPPLPGNVGQALATGTRLHTAQSPKKEDEPLKGSEGGQQAIAARPSADALQAISGKDLLPGDAVISRRLLVAVQEGRQAHFKVNVDYPYSDGAALGVSQEAKTWIQKKMADFGFEEAPGKPDLVWLVRVQPGENGDYGLDVSVSFSGQVLFSEKLTVPAQYSSERMTQVFGEKFAPKIP